MNVAIIPARGGSQRIHRKNIKTFHGQPIIAYSIEAAQQSCLFDSIWVSTEDQEIGALAMRLGAKYYPRPPALAEVNAPDCGTQRVVADALQTLWVNGHGMPTWACCIYPCAPLLRAADLRLAAEQAAQHPWNYVYAEGQFYYGLAARFIAEPDNFSYSLRTESFRYIDINTEEDWQRAERMYAQMHPTNKSQHAHGEPS